jgi:hypothetical protein
VVNVAIDAAGASERRSSNDQVLSPAVVAPCDLRSRVSAPALIEGSGRPATQIRGVATWNVGMSWDERYPDPPASDALDVPERPGATPIWVGRHRPTVTRLEVVTCVGSTICL